MKSRLPILRVARVKRVGKYSLRLLFSDGKEQVVDFRNFLRHSNHPEIRKYLKEDNFKRFKLDRGDLMWGDFDLIFPISDLYNNQLEHSEEYRSKVA